MLLENLSWPEVKKLKLANKVVLFPLGSFEQHGPHLPLTTDTDIVTAIARRLEQKRSDKILCLPTLWPGHSTHHLRSEEHTSELQSQSNLVCRLLLEKK